MAEVQGGSGEGERVKMAVFGVIFCAYESEDLLSMSLSPWIAAKRERLGGNEYRICAVACPFTGFPHDSAKPLDGTIPRLQQHLLAGDIDHLITSPYPIAETEARGQALRWLVGEGAGAEVIWQADADEAILKQDILNIARFVEKNPWMKWFRVSYRNLVFDEKHWLAEPFTPPRLHRVVGLGGYQASGFYEDNNVMYSRYNGRYNDEMIIQDVAFPSVTIPSNVAFPAHHSWMNSERSRLKEIYQRARWGHCSFKWNEEKGTLEFDSSYYAARGEPLPEVISLDTSP